MSKTTQELQVLMVDQIKRRGYYPADDKEVLLRLDEEVGEVMEAVRENQSYEMVNVFWNLLRLTDLKNIDMEKAFLEKFQKNELRPLENNIN